MTTSELVLQTLAGHHEQSVGQLYKKLAGQPGINNSKSVSNALMRLKKDGRVTNTFDSDRAIWLWRTVKEGEVIPQPECHSEHDLEMASDVAEATLQQNLTVADADMVATLDSLDTEREVQERQSVAETPEPVSVEVKVEQKIPISVITALNAFMRMECPNPEKTDAHSFMRGIEFAEKHHGISQ